MLGRFRAGGRTCASAFQCLKLKLSTPSASSLQAADSSCCGKCKLLELGSKKRPSRPSGYSGAEKVQEETARCGCCSFDAPFRARGLNIDPGSK